MANLDVKRERLIKFFIKEIPGLIPWVGDIWKDAVDEFTESDLDKALEKIADYQEKGREAQKLIITEILQLRSDLSASKNVLATTEKAEYDRRQLAHLLDLNWGNSRFLFALQNSNRAFVFNHNIDAAFCEGFLDMLDTMFPGPESLQPPFAFPRGSVIAFPDGYEE